MLKSDLLLLLAILQLGLSYVTLTPLDDYVNKYDPNYQYKITNWVYKGDGYTMYCINMVNKLINQKTRVKLISISVLSFLK